MNNPKDTTKNLTIPAKILAIQTDLSGIVKLSYNAFQKYHYFTQLQVLELLKPLLRKHDLTLMISDDTSQPFIHEKEGAMHLVKYLKKMVISDGQTNLEFSFWAAAGNQDLAKAKGAAETYAIKYFLSKFFLIPIQDEEEPDFASESAIKEKMKENNLKQEFSPLITATIQKITPKTDKSKSKYLLITLDQLKKNVFVFPYKVAEETWENLQVGSRYQFVLEEKEEGILILTKFRFDE